MANRYAVVARTYLGRRLAGALYLFFFLACFAVAGSGPDIMSVMFLINTYVGIGLFALCVAYHINEQFANPRSHLLPDFGPPHLAIAAAVSLPTLALTATVLAWVGDKSLLGTAAVVLAIYTALLGIEHLNVFLRFALLVILATILATPQGRMWFEALVEGQANPSAALLLCTCAALLMILGTWLLRYNEDRPQIGIVSMNPWSPKAEGRLWSVWKGRWHGDLPWFVARKMPANQDGGLWRRVQLWRVGMSSTNTAVEPLLMTLGSFALFGVFTGLSPNAIEGLLPNTFIFGAMFNTMLVGLWLQRWPRLGYELLRPTTRRDFCRQMGLAFACELFEGWLWCFLVLGLGVAVWSPALLQTWEVAVFLSLFACMLLSQLAAMAWLESYCSHVLLAGAMSRQVLVIGAMWLISIPSLMLWTNYQKGFPVLISILSLMQWTGYQTYFAPVETEDHLRAALGMMLLCAGLLYGAYRRWLWMDLP